MENKLLEENNPWKTVPTVTTFDKGLSSYSTRCLSKKGKKKDNKLITRVSSSSILISSLISHLHTFIEKDPVQSKKLYFLLCDAMHQMKLIDPSYKLEGFELIQDRYMDAVYHLISVARSTIQSDNSIPIPRPIVSYISPYQDQFRETGFIAGGGFGNVFKAVHKLDEVEYAIKKIVVRPDRFKTVMNHLEEVKTLAKLNHTNIVSYKQAWIEPITAHCIPQLPSTSATKTNDKTYENGNFSLKNSNKVHRSESFMNCKSEKLLKFLSDHQSLHYCSKLVDKNYLQHFESSSDIISFREENEMYTVNMKSDVHDIIEMNSRTSTEESISSDESLKDRQICQYSSQTKQYAMLYIQMALCEKTLRQWLDERLGSTPISIIAGIATQILCGLNYIHSLKIVHHDIKPSNIFISTSGKLQVQLGDFGLACPLQRENHDVIMGTCMYAAPEQLKGECNPKSDIYSLGIVLLELLIPMQTSMECIKIVETLKTGQVPKALATSYPKWAKTISQLVQMNPVRRPSADELLEDLKIDKELIINKLQDQNGRLLNENNILHLENSKKDQIIEDQRLKIKELEAKLAKLECQN